MGDRRRPRGGSRTVRTPFAPRLGIAPESPTSSRLRRVSAAQRKLGDVRDVVRHLRDRGPFARRADLLKAGCTDTDIRRALADRRVFRVRHGWYALPGTPDLAVRAVRVGGRVTGIAALRSYGLQLPRPAVVDLAVPATAARLRRPHLSRERLHSADGVRIRWVDPPRGGRDPASWRSSEGEALAVVLATEARELAVAACDGLIRYRGWTPRRIQDAMALAPARVRAWASLVDGRADSWGETAVRLRLRDAGLDFEPQAEVPGVGRLDGRIGPRTFVEVDGAQHTEFWAGDDGDWFEKDRLRDALVASLGGRVLRITYPMFRDHWELFLVAARRTVASDLAELHARGIAV